MKKTISLSFLVAAAIVVMFSRCSKDQAANASVAATASTAATAHSAVRATLSCGTCSESATKLTGATALAYAQQYAPLIWFDRSSPDYPTSVEVIWANTNESSIVCGGQLTLANDDAPTSMNFPTYYDVQVHPNDANRIFIEYWWGYKRQGNCIGSTGGHDYDWEHMVIQFNKSTQKVISTTYFQHAGWYTKAGTATPVVGYVGKIQHGMYHNKRTTTLVGYSCSYWGDYRNPADNTDQVLTQNNLVQMSCASEYFGFNGTWGNTGQGPLYRTRNFWNFPACKGTDGDFGTDGCSQCDYGSGTLIGNIN